MLIELVHAHERERELRERALRDSEDCLALAQHSLLHVVWMPAATGQPTDDDKDVAAFVVGIPGEYIHMIAVPQHARKQGRGREAVRLFQPLFVYSPLPESIDFWTRCGFRQSTAHENELVRALS